MVIGRGGEAVEHGKQAIELDPFNALFHGMYAIVLLHQRRFDDAVAAARAALAIDPNQSVAESGPGRVFIVKGMRDEQLALQRQRLAKDPERVAALEQGLAEGGYEGAQRRLGDLLAVQHEKAGGGPTAGGPHQLSARWHRPSVCRWRRLQPGPRLAREGLRGARPQPAL